MIAALIYAILSPIFYAGVNVYDKYVVEHRVKNPLSYVVMDGTAMFAGAAIISLFLDWSAITPKDLLIPAIMGLMSGIQGWVYYYMIIKHDISHVIGIIYLYPILVAMASFLFLSEVIPWIGYVGMLLTITGVLMLSTRIKNLKKQMILALCSMTVLVATVEVLIKVTTTTLPALNVLVISSGLSSLILIGGIVVKSIRKSAKEEIRNLPVAGGGSILFYGGAATLYLAMSKMPATIVASISAIQPLAVLTFERIVDQKLGKISKDILLLPKLGAITLIVIGVVLIYIAELIRI